MEPNEIQLKRLYTALRERAFGKEDSFPKRRVAELTFQWRARYIELLPAQTLAVNFEHSTNNWRCLYVIQQNGAWSRREFYV